MRAPEGFYTVNQLSKILEVSIRTIHHYDDMKVLTPAKRTEGNYRLYTPNDLLKMKKIIVLKEGGMSLKDIATAVKAKDFKITDDHLDSLEFRIKKLQGLLEEARNM